MKATGLTASGLIIGLQWACSPDKPNIPFSPNVYLTINSDGSVVIVAHRQEMGTGIRTGLPLVLADELEADWNRISIQQAVGDEKIWQSEYRWIFFGTYVLNLCAKPELRPE